MTQCPHFPPKKSPQTTSIAHGATTEAHDLSCSTHTVADMSPSMRCAEALSVTLASDNSPLFCKGRVKKVQQSRPPLFKRLGRAETCQPGDGDETLQMSVEAMDDGCPLTNDQWICPADLWASSDGAHILPMVSSPWTRHPLGSLPSHKRYHPMWPTYIQRHHLAL
jgi:hypothetical protein